MTPTELGNDAEASHIVERYLKVDPEGLRTSRVIRHTFDQIYDGRHTGRYRLDQLSKTEKTHIGSLIEINLRREFDDLFQDGEILDFRVDGIEIDCKYSIRAGGWMVPREAINQLLLVVAANDEQSEWGVGVIRATPERLRDGKNQDSKRSFKASSIPDVEWIFMGADLPENILLHIPRDDADRILNPKLSGQKRVNELLRTVTNRVIPRGTIATVAQQDDYMKRLRTSGGAADHLASEGILVLTGNYASRRELARDLGAPVPDRGETVSVRVVPAQPGDLDAVSIAGENWRLAKAHEASSRPAPKLPKVTTA